MLGRRYDLAKNMMEILEGIYLARDDTFAPPAELAW
jgi:hypothetical protein